MEIFTRLDTIYFLKIVWLFPIAFALHEAEEWNILAWYHRNYEDLPAKTNTSIRTFLVFVSIVGFVWTAIATLPGNPKVAAFVLLPAMAIAFLNALQHVYWLIYFKDYAPGVVTSLLLLIPIIGYLAVRAVQESYVPIWYVVGLAILIVPILVQTMRVGNRLTSQFQVVHNFSVALAKRLGWM